MAKSGTDHIVALFKPGLSGVPWIGGPLSSLIGDYVPTSTQRSIERAIGHLQENLKQLEHRLDAAAVNKEELSEFFKSWYLVVVRSHHESRLKSASALLANILLKEDDPDRLSYEEADHFVRSLDSLSIGAIETLGLALKVA